MILLRKDRRIGLVRGDITELEVDAIVNAANESLSGGGGVDGAIHRAAGPELVSACDEIRRRDGGCPTGSAVLTPGFRLPAKWIVHTVGPVWSQAGKSADTLLDSSYRCSVACALRAGAQSLAIPNISTGVYGFPKDRAAPIALRAVLDCLSSPDTVLQVIFVCHDEENFRIYRSLFESEA